MEVLHLAPYTSRRVDLDQYQNSRGIFLLYLIDSQRLKRDHDQRVKFT
jgi:hypothetical protein